MNKKICDLAVAVEVARELDPDVGSDAGGRDLAQGERRLGKRGDLVLGRGVRVVKPKADHPFALASHVDAVDGFERARLVCVQVGELDVYMAVVVFGPGQAAVQVDRVAGSDVDPVFAHDHVRHLETWEVFSPGRDSAAHEGRQDEQPAADRNPIPAVLGLDDRLG